MKTKEQLISEYRKLKMGDVNGFNAIVEDLEIYLNGNGTDTQLELVLHIARVRKLDCPGISKEIIFEVAKPAVELLQNIGDDFFDIEAIATMLCFVESYELCKKLMQKALDALDTNLANHERCEATKRIVFCNMSYRLLYSRFYDKEDPKDVATLFNHCTKAGIAICEKMGVDGLVLRTILLVRKAVFYENFKKLAEALTALKALGNKAAFEGTQDDISEFYHKMDTIPPKKIINIFMGHQIKTRREELGLSREDLAIKVGSDADYIRTVERGSRGLSSPSFMAYVKALIVDFNYMFGNLSKHLKSNADDPTIMEINTLLFALSKKGRAQALEYLRILVKFDIANQPLKPQSKSTPRTRKSTKK